MLQRFGTVRAVLVLGLSVLLFCGCGSADKKRLPMGKVKGKVLYKGNPVAWAAVTFMADGAPRAGTGSTNGDGEFQLTTFDTNDGAVVGTHKVTVIQQSPPTKPMSPGDLAANGPPPAPKEGLIPSKYADIKTTPLTKSVEAGPNNITIELID